MNPKSVRLLYALALLLPASAATRTVGPGKQYPAPCAALTKATDGDLIEIDAAGTYVGDVCAFSASNLTIRGVNGRPHIRAGGTYANGKGTWVPQGRNTTIENVEMSGAAVPDNNGAAVRLDGVGLTLRYVYFHDNQDGLLTNGTGGNILIEYSEFDRNGDGAGYAHNIYVTAERSLTVRFSSFRRSRAGHTLKSRAARNYLYCNYFGTEESNGSLEVDLPNGGFSVLTGNVIQQGPNSENQYLVGYLEEGTRAGYDNQLFVAYNTFVNDMPDTPENPAPGIFLFPTKPELASAFSATIANNLFAGPTILPEAGLYPNVVFASNITAADPLFNDRAAGDYHLAPGSPAIAASQPQEDPLQLLAPLPYQYQSSACGQFRPAASTPAVGAFEFGLEEPNLSNPCRVDWQGLVPRVTLPVAALAGATTLAARVELDGLAPAGGAEIALAYSHPGLLSGPASVTIAAGESAKAISISVSVPPASTVFTITASYLDRSSDTTLSFAVPNPVLTELRLMTAAQTGGTTTNSNFIVFSEPVTSDETIALSSSQPDLVTVPASVTVRAGSDRASFAITTKTTQKAYTVYLRATHRTATLNESLEIRPVGLSTLLLPALRLGGPGLHTASVRLNGPAPTGGLTVLLASSLPASVALPATLAIPEGASSASFPVTLINLAAPVQAELTATLDSSSTSVTLTAAPLALATLALQPATTSGGLTSGANRLSLNSPAPAGQPITVRLTSANPALARVPATITIQPGLSSVTFQVVTAKVSAVTPVDITAAAATALPGVSTLTSTLTLQP